MSCPGLQSRDTIIISLLLPGFSLDKLVARDRLATKQRHMWLYQQLIRIRLDLPSDSPSTLSESFGFSSLPGSRGTPGLLINFAGATIDRRYSGKNACAAQQPSPSTSRPACATSPCPPLPETMQEWKTKAAADTHTHTKDKKDTHSHIHNKHYI